MTERNLRERQKPSRQQSGSSPHNSTTGQSSGQSADNHPAGGQRDQPPGGSGVQGLAAGQPAAKSGGTRALIALGLAVAIGLGAFFSMGGGGDQISDQETQSRQNSYQQLAAGAGMPLQLVTSDEIDAAVASLPDSVTDEQRTEIVQKVNEGRLQLAWLSVWDTHAEDGDILRFESSSSIPVDVVALNAKTTLAIPYPVDGSVMVTGVKDGGGGITVALESGATQIAWPTMQPGDTLNLPVTPAY